MRISLDLRYQPIGQATGRPIRTARALNRSTRNPAGVCRTPVKTLNSAIAMPSRVKRSQTLGHSGSTGLAGGDHLHFSMQVDGVQVNPVEWWDAHWIHDRIRSKLQ